MAEEKNNDPDLQEPKITRGNKSYASRVSPRGEAHFQLNLDLQLPLLDVVEPAVPVPLNQLNSDLQLLPLLDSFGEAEDQFNLDLQPLLDVVEPAVPVPLNQVNSDLQLLPLLDSFGEAEHQFVFHEQINEAYPSLYPNLHLGLPPLDVFPQPVDEASLSLNLNLELGLPHQLAIPAIHNDFPPEEVHEPENEAHPQVNLDLQLGPPLNQGLNLVPDPEPELVVPAMNHGLGQPNHLLLDLNLVPDPEPELVVPAVNQGLGQPNPLNVDLNLDPDDNNDELQLGLPYIPNLDLYVAVEPKFAGKDDRT